MPRHSELQIFEMWIWHSDFYFSTISRQNIFEYVSSAKVLENHQIKFHTLKRQIFMRVMVLKIAHRSIMNVIVVVIDLWKIFWDFQIHYEGFQPLVCFKDYKATGVTPRNIFLVVFSSSSNFQISASSDNDRDTFLLKFIISWRKYLTECII